MSYKDEEYGLRNVPLLMDDKTIDFGEEENFHCEKLKYMRPYVTAFHLTFRSAAIITYLLCDLFSISFIASFVVIILLLSMDFWTVKNITGRLMVGLRWWNYVDDNGNSYWVYESKKGSQRNRVYESEARIFWLALILCPALWSILFIVALFELELKWLLLLLIAIILSGSNLYGYVKCMMGKDQNISSATSDYLKKRVMQNVTRIGTVEPVRGFSSFKFLPGTNDRIIIALKTEEFQGHTATYITAFTIEGTILMHDLKIAEKKFEGLEFV